MNNFLNINYSNKINNSIIDKENQIIKNLIHHNVYILKYPSLKPHLPLYKNLFPLINKKVNIEPFKEEILSYKNSWYNKDNISDSWKSITLRSKNGNDQDFLEPIDFKNKEDNIFKYTENSKFFPTIISFLNSLKTDIYLVRLLKLNRGGIIKYHTDEVVFKNTNDIIRCHLPIITDSNIIFKIGAPILPPSTGYSIWKAETLYEKFLDPGYIWYTNVNCLHSVHNNSNIDRIHLVFDIKPPINFLYNLHNIN